MSDTPVTATATISAGVPSIAFEIKVALSTGEEFTFEEQAPDQVTALGKVVSQVTAMVSALTELVAAQQPVPTP